MARWKRETEALLFALIDERRAAGDTGHSDVLSLLLAARHENGSPMSRRELRDELVMLLAAGHETAASALAWVFEHLTRTPDVLARLTALPEGPGQGSPADERPS